MASILQTPTHNGPERVESRLARELSHHIALPFGHQKSRAHAMAALRRHRVHLKVRAFESQRQSRSWLDGIAALLRVHTWYSLHV